MSATSKYLTLYSAVLAQILSGEVTEIVVGKIHDLLIALGESVREGKVPLDDFIIFKVSHLSNS